MELPEDVKRGDDALERGAPEEAQARYLRQIALALTDIAALTIHTHQVHDHRDEHAEQAA